MIDIDAIEKRLTTEFGHIMPTAKVLEMISEIRELRADAERYRFLRDWQADTSDFCCASLDIYLPVPARSEGEPPRKHSACFDAAIDAARVKESA
jgi:hypothetical protein